MRKHNIFMILISMTFMLCACGDTSKLDKYYTEMNLFYSNVDIITETIDMIDENNTDAPSQVVSQLDKLEEQFKILSDMEVPEHFVANEDLADEAYSYMQEAVRLYKEWYSNPQDANADSTVSMALENYNRAMTRVNYISIVLQGNIPSGEGIELMEEETTDFTPVVDDNYDEEEYYEEAPEDDYEIVDPANPQVDDTSATQ